MARQLLLFEDFENNICAALAITAQKMGFQIQEVNTKFERYKMEMGKSRGEVERQREKGMAEFLPLKTVERRTIIAALRLSRECSRDAATILGISEATLYRRLKQYGR